MTVLCYHTVDPCWDSGLAMAPSTFAAHARWLARHRRVLELDAATTRLDHHGRLPRGALALTFDDGLAGVHEHAMPVLRDLGLPATIFVVADTLVGDRTVDWIDDPPSGRDLEVVTLDQLREMVDAGFQVGSHSLRHHRLPELDPAACLADLRTSREILEDLLGRPVRHLAYPRGQHDARVRAAAQLAGYDHAFALPEGPEPIGPFALPRVGVYRHNGLRTLRVKAEPGYLRARTHPGWRTVRHVHRRRALPSLPDAGGASASAPSPELGRTTAAPPVPAVADRGGPPPKVGYVMSRFPKVTETFVLNEILAVERLGVQVDLQPLLRERTRTLQPGAAELVARANYLPFVSASIVASHLWYLRHRPRRYLRTLAEVLVGTAGSWNFTVGALGIWPKVVHASRRMEADGVQHVHCHFASHPALAGFVISRLTGLPFSFTAHGSDLHVDRHMLPQKVAAAAAVVAISADNRDLIVADCGPGSADRVHVVHCGVDTAAFRPAVRDRPQDGRPVRLVCVGTLHEVKGQHVLLEALVPLVAAGMELEVRLVGDGPDRRRLARTIATLGLDRHVHLVGARDHPGVLEELRAADVAVAPSVPTAGGKREGIPVVLMEAMACGLPVVASDLSGIPELVTDRVHGRLVPPGDVTALATAIAELTVDPELRRRYGTAGRGRVCRDFDLDRNAARLLDLLLRSRSTPARPLTTTRGETTVASPVTVRS